MGVSSVTAIAELQALLVKNLGTVYCAESKTKYQFYLDGANYPLDGLKVLNSNLNSNYRWVGISGNHVFDITAFANAGFTQVEKDKLATVQPGATANAADAVLLNRANHIGSQPAATISNFTVEAAAAAPVQSVAGKTGPVSLDKADVGLPNVDNIPLSLAPVSTAQAAAVTAAQTFATQRTNHIGTQPAATVSDLAEVVPTLVSLTIDGGTPDSVYVPGSSIEIDGGEP